MLVRGMKGNLCWVGDSIDIPTHACWNIEIHSGSSAVVEIPAYAFNGKMKLYCSWNTVGSYRWHSGILDRTKFGERDNLAIWWYLLTEGRYLHCSTSENLGSSHSDARPTQPERKTFSMKQLATIPYEVVHSHVDLTSAWSLRH